MIVSAFASGFGFGLPGSHNDFFQELENLRIEIRRDVPESINLLSQRQSGSLSRDDWKGMCSLKRYKRVCIEKLNNMEEFIDVVRRILDEDFAMENIHVTIEKATEGIELATKDVETVKKQLAKVQQELYDAEGDLERARNVLAGLSVAGETEE